MNIFMAGVDYKTASLSVRERFSFSDEAVQKHVQQIARQAGVQGCLLLSTCNRTELYLSCGDGFSPDAAAMLCSLVDLPVEAYRPYFTSCQGHDVLMYLMQLASGLQSQVRGENQILGQVKAAVVLAREAGGMDAVLETVFRNAISAGKRTRTLVALNPVDVSCGPVCCAGIGRPCGQALRTAGHCDWQWRGWPDCSRYAVEAGVSGHRDVSFSPAGAGPCFTGLPDDSV